MSAIEKWLWNEAAHLLDLRAGFFCEESLEDSEKMVVLSSYKCPLEPFNGSDSKFVRDVLAAALVVNTTHEHNIKNLALSNVLPRFGVEGGCCSVMWYSKIEIDKSRFSFLGFPKNNQRAPERASTVNGITAAFTDYFHQRRQAEITSGRLEVIEKYTKEVGHDLANATQALLAKLRAIQSIDLSAEAMKRKAEDSIKELKQVYGIADGLGLALEQEYSARSIRLFEVDLVLRETAEHLEQEAGERNIKIETPEKFTYRMKGDKAAIRLALQHIVGNAIKYSHSDRVIKIGFRPESDQFLIFVENEGIGLPRGIEEKKIFDFGYRSPVAKKMHVNGSGIGLYTAAKIIRAHGGRIWGQMIKEKTLFYIAFPPNGS